MLSPPARGRAATPRDAEAEPQLRLVLVPHALAS